MSVVVTQTFPLVDPGIVQEVTERMGVNTDPPRGLLAHAAVRLPDSMRVVDIWDSQEDFEAFASTRLGPTVEKVLAERHIDLDTRPQTEILETFEILVP